MFGRDFANASLCNGCFCSEVRFSHANRHCQHRCQRQWRCKCGVHPCNVIPMQAMPKVIIRHLLSRGSRCPTNDMENLLKCLPGAIESQQSITCHARRASVQKCLGVGVVRWMSLFVCHAADHVQTSHMWYPTNVFLWAGEQFRQVGFGWTNMHSC